MVAKRKSDYKDLRSPSEIPEFNKAIDSFKGKGMLVLVHADFCGPCQNYKKTVWNDLVTNPNRKMGMLGIHHDQLANAPSPFSDANIKGYPSVLYVGHNGSVKKVSNFNDPETGSLTNAMPSADMRNKELMEKIITAEPEMVPNLIPSLEKVDTTSLEKSEENEITEMSNEPDFDTVATAERNKVTRDDIMNEITNTPVPSKRGTPPPLQNDLLDSQSEKENITTPFNPNEETSSEPTPGKGTAVGGTLYSALLDAARHKSRPAKSTRRNKKKKKLTHKRTRAPKKN
jgi:hypothetical protein